MFVGSANEENKKIVIADNVSQHEALTKHQSPSRWQIEVEMKIEYSVWNLYQSLWYF